MADAKLIKSANLEKVQSVDFVARFTENIKVLEEVLGITHKIEKVPGQLIKTYEVTGTLESGDVAEGETIPLSKYATEVASTFELTVKKWRKATTVEAINDKGYDQAVIDTDDKMISDIQNVIKGDFFDFIKTGTGVASAATFQNGLAQTWGQLQVLFENYDNDGFLYFVHPLDIADYLGNANVTVQTAFGFTFIKNFLGIYDVAAYSGIPRGTVIGTAKENIILYYTNPQNSDLAQAFDFVTDQTGYIGVHKVADYTNMTAQTVAICGMALYCEIIDGLVLCDFAAGAAEEETDETVDVTDDTDTDTDTNI